MLISSGKNQNISNHDIVIYENFAIGEITKSEDRFSFVNLVTSPSENIPAIGQTNGAKGNVSGDLGSILIMKNILPEEKIEVGEYIITSGVNSYYPYGLILGKVIRVNQNLNSATKEAEIEIIIDVEKMNNIFVIKGTSR